MKPKILKSLASLVVDIGDVELDPRNARSHPDRNIESIKRSLQRFGQRKPIVLQKRKKGKPRVIAGNGMLTAARDLGWTRIAAVMVEESDRNAEAFAIADNRTGELSTWDKDVLAELIAELRKEDWDLEEIGFTQRDLETMFGTTGQPNEDDVPDPPSTPITRAGDLWCLGRHRLLCGDSGNPKDVDRLVGGLDIHLVNTDPPYNVKVEPRSNKAIAAGLSSFKGLGKNQKLDAVRHKTSAKTKGKMRAKDRPLLNDFVSDDAFDAMLLAWFGNMARVLLPGRSYYIWGGYANCANYPPALKKTGLYFSQAIIWVKEHPVLTRKDFMGNHEWCFYGWREGGAHEWFGPNNVSDTWLVKKVNPQSMVHLTEKPVELARRAMEYSCRPGENVLDLFGGSGSTLIAADETDRAAFLMEMDPLYCDVILARYERFTGEKARLGRPTGATMASTRKRRKIPA